MKSNIENINNEVLNSKIECNVNYIPVNYLQIQILEFKTYLL